MTPLYANRDAAAAAVEKLKVFAQPQRLMILSCLMQGERNVSEIAAATNIGQPALSQQLAELRRAELVATRREAKLIWYALADEGVARCVRNIEAIFGGVGTPDETAPRAPAPDAGQPPAGVAGFARLL